MASEMRWILSEPGCRLLDHWVTQISDERWSAAGGDEVALCVHGVFPLPMGLWVWKGRADVSEWGSILCSGPWTRNALDWICRGPI